MEKSEVPYGGVYRLTVDGALIGEFVPGPLWSKIFQDVQKDYSDVSYEWVPFSETPAPLELAVAALREAELHIPRSVEGHWITCSCGNSVQQHYWVRHSQGANGSALAPTVISQLVEFAG